jgi:YD repeat-containing protein
MALSPLIRWLCRSLPLAVVFASLIAQADPYTATITVAVDVTSPYYLNVCKPLGLVVFQGFFANTYPCHPPFTTPFPAADPLPDLSQVTGFPNDGSIYSVFPYYPCVPAKLGPWTLNKCAANQEPNQCKGGPPAPDASAAPSNALGDPVDVTTGALDQTPTDFDLGHGLRFARHYSSARLSGSAPAPQDPMGYAWEHSLEWSIQRRTDPSANLPLIFVRSPFHATTSFIGSQTGNSYTPSQRGDGSLTIDTGGTAHYTAENGTVATFSPSNQLLTLQPLGEPLINVSTGTNSTTYSNGQQVIVITTYSSGANAGQISTVTGGGQTWNYTYDGSQNLQTVTGPDPTSTTGGTITWTYGYSGAGLLSSITRSDLPQNQTLASWAYNSLYAGLVSAADEPTLDQPLSFSYSNYSSTSLNTTVSAGSNQLAVFNTTNSVVSTVTNQSSGAPTNPNPYGVNPVPGGAGVPVPFALATTDSLNRWQTQTDKNGNVTSYSNYDAFWNPAASARAMHTGTSPAAAITPITLC